MCIFNIRVTEVVICIILVLLWFPGADPGFQVTGAHLEKSCRAEGRAKIFGVFRVKNHDFTREKNHIFFFNFFGGGAPGVHPPRLGSAPGFNHYLNIRLYTRIS